MIAIAPAVVHPILRERDRFADAAHHDPMKAARGKAMEAT